MPKFQAEPLHLEQLAQALGKFGAQRLVARAVPVADAGDRLAQSRSVGSEKELDQIPRLSGKP